MTHRLTTAAALALGLALTGCLGVPEWPAAPEETVPVRVLFVGNSYTYVNDLPHVFTLLARSGGFRIDATMEARGGELLQGHIARGETAGMLRSGAWNYVVLQEQSEVPATEPARSQVMYPATRLLAASVRSSGATPVLFMTWAHQRGWPAAALDYPTMQTRVNLAYSSIGRELHAPVAPVGFAWREARRELPELQLWQQDGSHPAMAGTYLAACVFYAVIAQRSPEGLPYRAGLPRATARTLQSIAARSVLDHPTSWQLQ